MKVTKEQLQKIIQEELTTMQQEGEVDEGIFDKLLGRGDKFGDFVSDEEVKSKIDSVQAALGKLHNIASKQENRPLTNLVSAVSNQVSQMYSNITPKGSSRITPAERGVGAATVSYKNAVDDLKSGKRVDAKRLIKYVYQMENNGAEPGSIFVRGEITKLENDPSGYEKLKQKFLKTYQNSIVQKDKFATEPRSSYPSTRRGRAGTSLEENETKE